MAGNRSAAWVVPVLVLAVPGVMFYVWWSQLNAEQRKQMTMKIRRRTPEVFNAAPADGRLTNPIAQAQVSTETAVAAGTAPPVMTPPPSMEAAAAAPAVAPAPPPAETAPPPPAVASAPPLVAISTSALAVFARDPTLSPYDVVKLEKLRHEREERERELREGARRLQGGVRQPPIEDRIDLQGVVSTPDSGNRAIVNGEVMGEGELVEGAKIVRITSSGVVFLHRGRKFTKTITK